MAVRGLGLAEQRDQRADHLGEVKILDEFGHLVEQRAHRVPVVAHGGQAELDPLPGVLPAHLGDGHVEAIPHPPHHGPHHAALLFEGL